LWRYYSPLRFSTYTPPNRTTMPKPRNWPRKLKTQSPTSSASLFQNNFNFGIGPNDATQWILNVQPVMPITLNKDWNLITRTIMPIINQPSPAPGIGSAFGLGDINPTVFLSPANSGKLIWGVGPTMTFPTATESLLGNGKWSAGPSLVVLTTPGHWVIGALANNQWSFAGRGSKSVDALLVHGRRYHAHRVEVDRGAAESHGTKGSAETPQHGRGAETASYRPRRGGDRHQQGVKTLPGRFERSTSSNRVIHLSGSNRLGGRLCALPAHCNRRPRSARPLRTEQR